MLNYLLKFGTLPTKCTGKIVVFIKKKGHGKKFSFFPYWHWTGAEFSLFENLHFSIKNL